MAKMILSKRKVLALSILVAIVVAGGLGVFFVMRQSQNWNDVSVVTVAVGRHYFLPSDEVPALATVEDKARLNSEFLRSAENGDKLLVYKNAKIVILYRPSIDRVIEVGPVSIADMSE